MIEKIHEICGVGNFKGFRPDRPIELDKLNLIYGDNGTGKSTLARIFGSVGSKSPHVLRSYLSIAKACQLVALQVSGGKRVAYSSEKGEWSAALQNVWVFDQDFINANVYVGNSVNTDNLRNLAQLIIGERAVEAARQEEALKQTVEARRATKRDLENKIQSLIHRVDQRGSVEMSIDEFLRLSSVEDVDDRIAVQAEKVSTLERRDAIIRRSLLETVVAPVFPVRELEDLLGTTIAGLEATAESQVRKHIRQYDIESIEGWIEQGTDYVDAVPAQCPFCGQDLAFSELIERYQHYFGEAYKKHTSSIRKFAELNLNVDAELQSLSKVLAVNAERIELWSDSISSELPSQVDPADVQAVAEEANKEIQALLSHKQSTPLKEIELSADLTNALKKWGQLVADIEAHNEDIQALNSQISGIKATLAKDDLQTARNELMRLQLAKERHSNGVNEDCESLVAECQLVKKDNRELGVLRETINCELNATYCSVMTDVTEYLRKFSAGFEIVEMRHSRDKKSPRAKYMLKLQRHNVEMEPESVDEYGRRFGNILSEGDKRTLAIALFLALLKQQDDLSQHIVVLDDPVTSFDENRRMNSVIEIASLCSRAKQVFVLSHRADFLYEVFDYISARERSISVNCLVVADHGESSQICQDWDIETAVKSEHLKRIKDVVDFIAGTTDKEPKYIFQQLRFILEGHFRATYPDLYCRETNALGAFFRKLKNQDVNSSAGVLWKRVETRVENLRPLLNREHHYNFLARTVNRQEILPICAEVLDIVGRPKSSTS